MPFARKDFDELRRQMDVYLREVALSSATVDVTVIDGQRLCVLKTLDVTENTVTFLVYDEQAGLGPLEGREKHRNRTAVLLPHDAVRSIAFSPVRGTDARAGFAG